MKKGLMIVLGLILVLSSAGFGYADTRGYVWTYEYQTLPRGLSEIEYYFTLEQPDSNEERISIWKHWLELEYGLAEHWDIALYQQFKQTNNYASGNFAYDGYKVRTRYRVAEKGQLPVDTVLYAEYIRSDNLEKPDVLEGKAILTKDISNYNIAYNQIVEFAIENKEIETDLEYALGARYVVLPDILIGVESKGNYNKGQYALGPTFSVSVGSFWLSFGLVFGLNNNTDDVQSRLITGIPF